MMPPHADQPDNGPNPHPTPAGSGGSGAGASREPRVAEPAPTIQLPTPPVVEEGRRVATMPASPAVAEGGGQFGSGVLPAAARPMGTGFTEPSGVHAAPPVPAAARGGNILPPPQPLPPTAGNLLAALRHRWKPSLALGVAVGVLVALVTWLVLPRPAPVYVATAGLRVAYTEPRIVFPIAGADRSDFMTFLRTQLDLIRSRAVLQPALRSPAAAALPWVQDDPEGVLRWMERELKAELGSAAAGAEFRSEVIRVSLSGNNPAELVTLVNAVKDSYLQEVIERQRSERQARIPLLERLYRDAQRELQRNRREWQLAATQGGAEAERRLLQQYDEYTKALNQAELDLMRANLRMEQLRKNPTRPPETPQTYTPPAPKMPTVPDRVIDEQVERDPALQDALTRAARLKTRLEHFEDIAANPSTLPDYRQDRAKFEALVAFVDQRRKELRPKIKAELEQQLKEQYEQQMPPQPPPATVAAPVDTEVDRAQRELDLLDQEFKRLSTVVDEKARAVNEFIEGRQSRQSKQLEVMEGKRLEIERLETHSKFVLDELEAVRTEANAPPRAVTLFDAQEAVPQPRTDPLREVKMVGMAGFGAFFCCVLGVAFLEFRSRRIYGAEDVTSQLGMRLLGVLPAMPEHVRNQPVRTDALEEIYRHNIFASSVDSLRTVLLHETAAGGARVLMVASAVEGEGKTTLACHLAVSLARAGKRTLLVDADMVHPKANTLFGLAATPGLSDLLRGDGAVADLVRPTAASGLWLLPSGKADPAAFRALDHEAVGRIFERLKAEYDVVLVDSSPLLPLAQSMLIAKATDAVMLTVLGGVSRVLPVYAGYHRLAVLGVPVLGAVFMGAQQPSFAYAYGSRSNQPVSPQELLLQE